jgi:hypothetical protein
MGAVDVGKAFEVGADGVRVDMFRRGVDGELEGILEQGPGTVDDGDDEDEAG